MTAGRRLGYGPARRCCLLVLGCFLGCLVLVSASDVLDRPSAASPARASLRPTTAATPFSGLAYRNAGGAEVIPAAPPASSALGGANDLVASGSTVLAAGDSGLSRSLDGGSSWRQALSGFAMWSLSAPPGGGFVALGDRPRTNGTGQAVVATSRDGLHWRVEPAKVTGGSSTWQFGYGYRIAFNGIGPRAVGVAVPDIVASATPPDQAFRSTDGGRDWAPLSLPGADTGLAMLANGRTLYATAPGPTSSCEGAVYRSLDAGASWALLASSCEPYPLYAVQFLDARHGFAAGGFPEKFNGEQEVEATSDGGRSWQSRLRSRRESGPSAASEIVRLDMVDDLHGWALSGGCEMGENGPCGGFVWVTEDGGRRWFHSAEAAVGLLALGEDRALAGNPPAATLALTTDAGRDWRLQSPPSAVTTSAVSGSDGWLLWSTNLGRFDSTDRGASWDRFDPPASSGASYDSWYLAPPSDLLGVPQLGAAADVRASTDGGATWRDVAVGSAPAPAGDLLTGGLGPGGRAAVIEGPMGQCLSQSQVKAIEAAKPGWRPPSGSTALFTSSDGGRSWRLVNGHLPFAVDGLSPVAVYGSLLVTIDDRATLEISADGGHTWRAQALGAASPCAAAAYRREVWLACTVAPAWTESWVLHSTDSGATWTAYQLPPSTAVEGTAPAGNGIVATGGDSATMPAGGSLWSTRDGGRRWRQSWPSLSGEQ
jgi:hypothetical protein